MESQDSQLEPAARDLAASLLPLLRPGFRERQATAEALAELILDAAEAALSLEGGAPAGPPLATLELLATRADVFAWDGPPGWDEILARGLQRGSSAALSANGDQASVLDGLGDAADRSAQLARAEAAARAEASRLLALGRAASGGSGAAALVQLHGSLLRLIALAAAAAPLALPEDPAAGALPPPGEAALIAELDDRARAGSDFAAAQDEWLGRLLNHNPAAAAEPAFRTFFAGLSQWLRVAIALREVQAAALQGRAEGDPEALIGAVGGWQPVRWSSLRKGVPAVWWAELFPPAAPAAPHALLARECSAALDAVGRLWSARDLSLTAFAALATAAAARTASALALWEALQPM